ncbi:hypothetical protein [Salibacterium qingdaonense]|uniref:Uncharacterized protein n=1 Tax=Salibacterium qingdaonense TaxID=266892 RepID=A0A1I4KQ62_9BACI|nr:hypothetical protein [Salibacterium qingdaonense]SFL80753.1 hypothetical protein SAMN04488054_105151 [Salibacterium qingdaonense]
MSENTLKVGPAATMTVAAAILTSPISNTGMAFEDEQDYSIQSVAFDNFKSETFSNTNENNHERMENINLQQFANNIFSESREFTEKEEEMHTKMLNSISIVKGKRFNL